MKIIGITGSIGTGKSTVSSYISLKGYKIIDADVEARNAVRKGSKALSVIRREFGDSVMNDDGTLNRKALGEMVFGNDDKLRRLDEIVHPSVKERVRLMIDIYRGDGERVVFFDCPLLFEADLAGLVDEVWVVSSSDETRIERLRLRDGMDDDQIEKRMASQMDLSEKERRADRVIRNDGSILDLQTEIDKLLEVSGI